MQLFAKFKKTPGGGGGSEPLRVFLAGHCCYGNLLCHKINSNMFTNDWAVVWYHDFGINRYRVVIMTHQILRLVLELF